jgi:hypothetical protein
MAFGLEPLVRGWNVRNAVIIASFLGSMTLAASVVGAILGAAGELLPSGISAGVVVVSASVLALLVELRLVSFATPYRHWQVPRDWPTRFGALRGYSLWGATLGVGVFSYVPFASYHVLLLWMVLSGSPVTGGAMGILYGVGRGLGALVPAVVAGRRTGQLVAIAAGPLGNQETYRATQIVGLTGTVVTVLMLGA